MNKKLAFDNRLCYERSLARQHALHHQKLQSMVPTALSPSKVYLDDNAPSKQPHLASNPKRKQRDRERQQMIAAQNHLLAAKMEHILHRQENVQLAAASSYGLAKSPRTGAFAASSSSIGSTSPPPRTPAPPPPKAPLWSPSSKPVHGPARVHMPGIRLDATQTPIVDCYLSPEVALGRGAACNKRTLINRGVQRQQQERLAEENRRMKERVASQKPSYNAKQWDADWRRGEHKFSHIRQNGTVGYLLPPPPKTASALGQHPHDASHATAPLRALKTQRAARTSPGLPLLQHTGNRQPSHQTQTQTQRNSKSRRSCPPSLPPTRGPNAASRPQRPSLLSSCNGDDDDLSDDGAVDVRKLPPCVLLEATTRNGVQLQVLERQIELVQIDASSPRDGLKAGDRGLVIQGIWNGDVRRDHAVSLETLKRLAQEIDDLEIMIKLETVHQVAHVGNFPRLSVLLTEPELEKLLVQLVQRLHIDVREAEKLLVIATWHQRGADSGGGVRTAPPSRGSDDLSAPSAESRERPRPRPRTCPSMLSSANAHPLDFIDALSDVRATPDSAAADACETTTATLIPSTRARLAVLLRTGRTRFVVLHRDALLLMRIAFCPETSRLSIHGVCGAGSECVDAHAVFADNDDDNAHVAALVQQLQSTAQDSTRDDVVRQEIRRLLLTT